MNKLEAIFCELKSAVNSPKVHLVNYFDEIRNQIDIDCETYLSRHGLANQTRALVQQQELISEVDLFLRQCLSNVASLDEDLSKLDELELSLKSLDLTDKDAVLAVEKNIYCALNNRKRLLFRNRGIIFVNIDNYEKYFESPGSRQRDPQVLFGLLFILEDEFLLFSDQFQPIRANPKGNSSLDTDWYDDFLRIHFMKKHLEMRTSPEPIGIVTRIKLDMANKQELSLWGYHLDKLIFIDYPIELPALRTLKLTSSNLKELEPTAFQNLIHLEHLDLTRNMIENMHPESFASNKNLKVLKLSDNKIKVIPTGLFQGLANLESLYLYGNEIAALERDAFKGLKNLDRLHLNCNQICGIAGDVFEDLASLTVLNLALNRIRCLKGSVFKGLVSLIHLDLSRNCISEIPAGAFRDLVCLEKLYLGNNVMSFSDQSMFNSLGKLTHLELRDNLVAEIREELFRGLVSLKYLDILENR